MKTTRIILHLDERDHALTTSAFWRTVVLPARRPNAKRDSYDGSLYTLNPKAEF